MMNISAPPTYFYKDTEGIRTDENVGIGKASGASYNLVVGANSSFEGIVRVTNNLAFTPIAAPGSPGEGYLYYDSTAHKLKVYTGGGWETVSSA